MSTSPVDNSDNSDGLDAALRRQLQHTATPVDAGFSLRVMAALPPHGPSPAQHRWARWMRRAQWTASTMAALGFAGLQWNTGAQAEAGQVFTALSLLGLMIFWSVPSRLTRG